MLRYQEKGELHMDFHGSMNAAVEYVGSRYGREGLREVFRATAHNVYRSIYEKLKAGDWSELLEHWQYFMEREGADFSIEVTDEEAVMIVRRCPAITHLRKLGLMPSQFFCDQTIMLNEAWCEGTPFEAVTAITGDGSCVQKVRLLRPLSGRNDEGKKGETPPAVSCHAACHGGRNDEGKKGETPPAVSRHAACHGGRNDEGKKGETGREASV